MTFWFLKYLYAHVYSIEKEGALEKTVLKLAVISLVMGCWLWFLCSDGLCSKSVLFLTRTWCSSWDCDLWSQSKFPSLLYSSSWQRAGWELFPRYCLLLAGAPCATDTWSGCDVYGEASTKNGALHYFCPLSSSLHQCYYLHHKRNGDSECLVSCLFIPERADPVPPLPTPQHYNLLDRFHCWQLALGYFSIYGLW